MSGNPGVYEATELGSGTCLLETFQRESREGYMGPGWAHRGKQFFFLGLLPLAGSGTQSNIPCTTLRD